MSKHHKPPHNPEHTVIEEPTIDPIEEEIILSKDEESTPVEDVIEVSGTEEGNPDLISEEVSDTQETKNFEDTKESLPPDPTIIYFLGTDTEKLAEIGDAKKKENPTLFETKIRETGTPENTLLQEFKQTSAEINRANQFVNEKISDPHVLVPSIKSADGTVLVNTKKVVIGDTVLKEGGRIENNPLGTAYLLNAINKPVRRIPLYASGISLEIVPPSPQQLTDFILRTDEQTRMEFGYRSGFPVYFFLDYGIKVEFLKLLKQIVIDSSLPNWEQKGALEENIQFSDYPALVTHVAAIMFPDGYDRFEHYCPRPPDPEYPTGCGHVIKKKINILHLLLNRGDLIKAGDIAHLQKVLRAGVKTTPEELKAYRESLGNLNKTLTVKTDSFHAEIVLKGISLSDHLEHASEMLAQMKVTFRDPSEEEMGIYLSSRRVKAIQVYVQSIKIFDVANPAIPRGYVTDKALIERLLGAMATDPSFGEKVLKPIEEFISSLQLTYIGYPKFKCPVCGYLPESPKTFFVMDPQQVFFSTSWKVLQNNISQNREP